jgi:hypothetical protein
LKPLDLHRFLIVFAAAAGLPAWGSGYGIYDTRTLALGGTGVALGDINAGHFYNPALTAFHDGHEDRTRDGLHSLQLLLADLSSGARTAAEAIDEDLEGRLSNAIDALNDVPTAEAARAGISAARDLERAMRELRGENIQLDAHMGYSLSIPADREGGAFFLGSRLLAEGTSNVSDADFELLDDYVEALEFIESGGSVGQRHDELYDGNGRLIDPSERIESSATGAAALVTEIGVSAAWEVSIFGQPVSLGAAPKAVYLRVFNESWQVVNGEFESNGEQESDLYLNLDLGAVVTFAEKFRVGLAVKDLRRKTLYTPDGAAVFLEPRSRLGLAYVGDRWSLGLDADLAKSTGLRRVTPRQDVSLGVEYRVLDGFHLRAGYRHDLEGISGDQISTGLGWRLGRFALDLAYGSGSDTEGAGLHLGWRH